MTYLCRHRGGKGVAPVHLKLGNFVLEKVGGQHHALHASSLGKTWYQFYRRLGGPRGRCG